MKKIVLLTPLLFIGLSSCRKNRTCVCSQNGTEVGTANYINVKKSEAKEYCAAFQSTYSSNSGVSCVVN